MKTPIIEDKDKNKEELKEKFENQELYIKLIGKLIYLSTISRLDITYIVEKKLIPLVVLKLNFNK